jgi:hypothetical protein
VEGARRYAFHFFFRRMIPLEFMRPSKNAVPYRVELRTFRELGAGRSRGLDVICDGILFNRPFTYPAETEISAEDETARILASAPAR